MQTKVIIQKLNHLEAHAEGLIQESRLLRKMLEGEVSTSPNSKKGLRERDADRIVAKRNARLFKAAK